MKTCAYFCQVSSNYWQKDIIRNLDAILIKINKHILMAKKILPIIFLTNCTQLFFNCHSQMLPLVLVNNFVVSWQTFLSDEPFGKLLFGSAAFSLLSALWVLLNFLRSTHKHINRNSNRLRVSAEQLNNFEGYFLGHIFA